MSARKLRYSPQEKKNAYKTLLHLEEELSILYSSPSKYVFSKDLDTATIQRAVLYHRIQQTPQLRFGEKSPENDALYNKLAVDVLQGRDPLVNYIQEQNSPETSVALLEEITACGSNKALFEELLERSEELAKEGAASADEAKNPDVPNKSAERLRVESKLLKSAFFRKLADNREATPKEFLAKPENAEAAKKMLAAELYRRSEEEQLEELEDIYQFEPPEKKQELIRQRSAELEKSLSENYETRLKELENSLQVQVMMMRLTHARDLEELNESVWNLPEMKKETSRVMLAEAEQKLVPGAVNAFLKTLGESEEDKKLKEALNTLPAMKDEPLPDEAKEEDYRKRINEYNEMLRRLGDENRLESEAGRKLGEILTRQCAGLEEAAFGATPLQNLFTFRANTEIDYFDPSDPLQRPMDALEAREKLIQGMVLEQRRFSGDKVVGRAQDISYDENTGMFIKGPEKLITRAVDFSEKTERDPLKQLEVLKELRELLKKTDPFYAMTSEAYNKTYDALDKVIKAHENLGEDANIRQVSELQRLYSELDANAALFIRGGDDMTKRQGERGAFRLDAMKSLQSISHSKHVEQISTALFKEKAELNKEKELLKPCKKIMEKWKKIIDPSDPAYIADFKKDFNSLSGRIGELQKRYGDMPYFKMGISEDMQSFMKKADAVQESAQPPHAKLNPAKVNEMKMFTRDSESKQRELYAMDPTIIPQKKPKEIEQPKKIFGAVRS